MSNLEIYYIISIRSNKTGIQPGQFFVISFYKLFTTKILINRGADEQTQKPNRKH